MISSIFLAAGQSKRMLGHNKLTKNIKDIPLINHSLKNILSSNIDEIIVVLGYQSEIIKKIIDKNNKIKFVFNANFEAGVSSSIKIGMENLSEKSDAFFISLADMPMISHLTYNKMIALNNKKKIIVPMFQGKQGNPVLFSKSMKNQIMSIQGDFGAKKILEIYKDEVLNLKINDPGITKDFDVMEDFNNSK